MAHVGDHVMADFGNGPVVAHVAKAKHDVGGEEKFGIQSPDGKTHEMAYREAEDRDAGGAGGTFWKIK